MRIFGGQRSFFVGRTWNRSFSKDYDIGTTGWWVGMTVLFLFTTALLTLFAVLLTDLSLLASVGIGAAGAVALMAYWFFSSFRR